eukprot:6195409-Pleurochrysis_carterae.AAC.6
MFCTLEMNLRDVAPAGAGLLLLIGILLLRLYPQLSTAKEWLAPCDNNSKTNIAAGSIPSRCAWVQMMEASIDGRTLHPKGHVWFRHSFRTYSARAMCR